MNNRKNEQSEGFLSSLIGERTPAKTSGLSYTLAALILFGISFVYALCFGGRTETQAALYASFLVAPVALLLTARWYFSYTKTPVRQFFKEQKCAPKYYWIALLMQIGLLSLSELNGLFLEFLERFGYQDSEITLPSMQGAGFVGVFITVAVIPAFFEELFFRGIFLREMRGFSLLGRVLLCGASFALYHQNPAQTLYQLVCGVAFAFVATRAKSFLPTVLSHFLNNGVIVVLTKCGITEYSLPVKVAMLSVSVVCLIGSVVWLALDKREEEKPKEKYLPFFLCALVGILVFGVSWVSTLFVGF